MSPRVVCSAPRSRTACPTPVSKRSTPGSADDHPTRLRHDGVNQRRRHGHAWQSWADGPEQLILSPPRPSAAAVFRSVDPIVSNSSRVIQVENNAVATNRVRINVRRGRVVRAPTQSLVDVLGQQRVCAVVQADSPRIRPRPCRVDSPTLVVNTIRLSDYARAKCFRGRYGRTRGHHREAGKQCGDRLPNPRFPSYSARGHGALSRAHCAVAVSGGNCKLSDRAAPDGSFHRSASGTPTSGPTGTSAKNTLFVIVIGVC